ncbi:MAG: LON peptidase substrate-binding domain-containing protein, partial [Prevotella sp.]|nr:LON peptidase substrate-binding domain-containing protein [Prevotella sp.]
MNKKPNTSIQMIADFEGDLSALMNTEAPEELPVLATRNMVLFPGVLVPILIGRKASMNLAKKLSKSPQDNICAVFCQKNSDVDVPATNELHDIGVYARLMKIIEMPTADNVTAIFQALGKCRLKRVTGVRPYYKGIVSAVADELPEKDDSEFQTLIDDLRTSTEKLVQSSDEIPDDLLLTLKNLDNPIMYTNFVCTNLPLSVKDKVKLLELNNIKDRIIELLKMENREFQLQQLKNEIHQKTREDLDEQQKEYFLQQQMKNIKEELGNGDGSPEKAELMAKAKKMKWPEEVAKVFYKELDKLDMFNTQSPEYSVQLNYLQQMVALPWGIFTKDNLDLKRAKRVLDRDHYGMEKVKERILEYLAVLHLRGDLKSPIICLYGPP